MQVPHFGACACLEFISFNTDEIDVKLVKHLRAHAPAVFLPTAREPGLGRTLLDRIARIKCVDQDVGVNEDRHGRSLRRGSDSGCFWQRTVAGI